MRGFLHDIYLRPSCYACPAKSGKSHSDITLADYWGIEHQHPEMDDDKGTSLVLLNTEKGCHSFYDLNTTILESTYRQALSGNPSIEKSVTQPSLRNFFYKNFQQGEFAAAIQKTLKKIGPSFEDKVRFNVKQLLKKLR